jgi:ankyrin repeat protein
LHPTDSPECCQLLLEHGADPNKEDQYGITPIGTACSSGAERVIDLLVKAGAKVDHLSKDKATALHECFYRGNTPCLRQLLKHNPDPSIRARTGKTPFECVFIDNMFEMLDDVLTDEDLLS